MRLLLSASLACVAAGGPITHATDVSALKIFKIGIEGDLIVKQAAAFIPQLTAVKEFATGSSFSSYASSYPNALPRVMASAPAENVLELKSLLKNFGSDKSPPHHNYSFVYAQIFGQLGRTSPLRLLEVGLGTNNTSILSSMGARGRPGASLRAWRSYLPNTNVFGADVDRGILFAEDRIKTEFVDQMVPSSFSKMHAQFGAMPFDLVIDDGMHGITSGINTIMYALQGGVKPGGYIVVEDIPPHQLPAFHIVDALLMAGSVSRAKLKTAFISPSRRAHNRLYVIQVGA